MLRSVFIALAVAATLFAFASLGEAPGGALVRAGTGVALGVIVASLAYGQATWMTVAAGALSPLAFAALEDRSLGLATAAMCSLWLLPRLVLAETRRLLVVLAIASGTAALIGGFVFASNIDGSLSARIASCVFAGSCLSLVGILVPVDTSVAWALRSAAAVVASPAREALERAARVHRQASRLSSSSARRAEWRALVRLADRRAALARIEGRDADESRQDLDERIITQAADLAPVFTVFTEPEVTVIEDGAQPTTQPIGTAPAPGEPA